MPRRDPANKIARTMLGAMDLQLGQVDEKSGRTAEALQEYRDGLDVFLADAKSDPGNVDARLNAGTVYLRIGNALARSGMFGQAEENYRKALEFAEPLTNRNPADEGRCTRLLTHISS